MTNSVFNIKIDFEKSHESYVYDKTTGREYLDFMGMFSSLPLGYNHPVFDAEFDKEIQRVSKVRTTNCEYLSDEAQQFEAEFKEFCGAGYSHFHYACTGALAVEWACKAAFHYKKLHCYPTIIYQQHAFHGISAYGNVCTDWNKNTASRFMYCNEEMRYAHFTNLTELKHDLIHDKRIAGILVEPVRCSNGDLYNPPEFFEELRLLADKYDVPLIFDEIQTGFCTTGKKWYWEHTGIEPDIVIFGKKAQVSGIMVKEKFADIFKRPECMCITYDGDLVDMVRCRYIMKAIQDKNLLENIALRGFRLKTLLKNTCEGIENIRGLAGLLAFDLTDRTKRDNFVLNLHKNGMICNPTTEKTIRLRPNLAVGEKEIERAVEIIKSSL